MWTQSQMFVPLSQSTNMTAGLERREDRSFACFSRGTTDVGLCRRDCLNHPEGVLPQPRGARCTRLWMGHAVPARLRALLPANEMAML